MVKRGEEEVRPVMPLPATLLVSCRRRAGLLVSHLTDFFLILGFGVVRGNILGKRLVL